MAESLRIPPIGSRRRRQGINVPGIILGNMLVGLGDLLAASERDKQLAEQERVQEIADRVEADTVESSRLINNVGAAGSEAELRGIEAETGLMFPEPEITQMTPGGAAGAPFAGGLPNVQDPATQARLQGRDLSPEELELTTRRNRSREAIQGSVAARRSDLEEQRLAETRADLEARLAQARTGERTADEIAAGSPGLMEDPESAEAVRAAATAFEQEQAAEEAEEDRDAELLRRYREVQIEATEQQIVAARARGTATDATPADRFAALGTSSGEGAKLFTRDGLGKILRGENESLTEDDFANPQSAQTATMAIRLLERVSTAKAANALPGEDPEGLTQADVDGVIQAVQQMQSALDQLAGGEGGGTGTPAPAGEFPVGQAIQEGAAAVRANQATIEQVLAQVPEQHRQAVREGIASRLRGG